MFLTNASMTDHISKKHRSWNMSRIKSADTQPELIIRKRLFKYGYRYKLNGNVSKEHYSTGTLPGKPDIVLSKYKTVIFIHGCFWHHHLGCKRATWPKSNRGYWIPKIKKNIDRDKKNLRLLNKMGWNVIIFWECEILDNKIEKKFDKVIKKMN